MPDTTDTSVHHYSIVPATDQALIIHLPDAMYDGNRLDRWDVQYSTGLLEGLCTKPLDVSAFIGDVLGRRGVTTVILHNPLTLRVELGRQAYTHELKQLYTDLEDSLRRHSTGTVVVDPRPEEIAQAIVAAAEEVVETAKLVGSAVAAGVRAALAAYREVRDSRSTTTPEQDGLSGS